MSDTKCPFCGSSQTGEVRRYRRVWKDKGIDQEVVMVKCGSCGQVFDANQALMSMSELRSRIQVAREIAETTQHMYPGSYRALEAGTTLWLCAELERAIEWIENAGHDWQERAVNAEYKLGQVQAENAELREVLLRVLGISLDSEVCITPGQTIDFLNEKINRMCFAIQEVFRKLEGQ